MNEIREVDPVLQRVRQATRRLRIPSDAVITQQILMFGNSFYGYRFTAPGVTAIWSAVEQTLKVCGHDGKVLDILSTSEIRKAG